MSDADAANAFNPPGSEHAAEDAAPSAQRTPSPPPSEIALAPASSIEEAATAAAALIASKPFGDSGLSDDADKGEEADEPKTRTRARLGHTTLVAASLVAPPTSHLRASVAPARRCRRMTVRP